MPGMSTNSPSIPYPLFDVLLRSKKNYTSEIITITPCPFFLLYINSTKEIKATVKQTHKESQGALGSLDVYHFIPLNSYHSEKICKGAESVLPKF